MRHDLAAGREELFPSEYDYLTNVFSRAEFEERAQRRLAEQPDIRCLLLLISLDDFAEINAKFGYAQGDELLRAIAARISAVRGDGIVGRVDGDVFAALYWDIPTYRRAEELLCELSVLVRRPQDSCSVTCSIGGAWFPDEGRDIRALFEQAQAKLNEAKSAGRNRFRLVHPAD